MQGAGQWFELQDLHVQDLLPQMITLAEAYIQVSGPQAWILDGNYLLCALRYGS